MPNNSGTTVIAPVRPQNAADTFPTAWANEILGGHHQAATLAERDAIPSDRIADGMLCSVASPCTTWRRQGGVWIELQLDDQVAENRGPATLVAGTPVVVHPGGWGVIAADAAIAVPAVAVAVDDIASGVSGALRRSGRVARASWLPLLGLVDLPPRARLWLAVGGGLALAPPTAAGALVHLVGIAADARTLTLAIDTTPLRRS